jgi:hypothetical protein
MRIRSIRPEFWSSEDIAALSWDARLIYIGLWSYVDDNGVGRDVEQLITAALFPLEDSFTEASVRVHGALKQLQTGRQITRYKVAGKPYLHVTAFDRHQKINRPTPGRYPSPTCEDAVLTESLTESSVSPHVDAPLGEGEKGRRGEGDSAKAETASRPTPIREEGNAGNVVALWIESLDRRPPGQVIGQVSKQIKTLLQDGFTEQEILAALDTMRAKGLNPSTLPSLVNDVINRPKLTSVRSNGPHAGMTKQIQLPGGRWREVYDDEVTYGMHTEWRPAL